MKFKSNAAYKKWLAKYKKGGPKKYQMAGAPGGGGSMYDSNVIPGSYNPSTAYIAYNQTDPAVTESLLQQKEELGTEADLSEMEANAAKRKQIGESVMPTLESITKSADKLGLFKKAAETGADDLTGLASPFTSSVPGANTFNKLYASGINPNLMAAEKMAYNAPIPGVNQGLTTARQAAEVTGQVGDVAGQTVAKAGTLKAGVQTYRGAKTAGQTTKAALKVGTTAAGWAGPQAVGTAASMIGKGIEKASDDKDATTMNVGETAGTMLKGAGYGATAVGAAGAAGLIGTAAAGTTAAAGAGLAGTLATVGATNIWNPVGWGALIAAAGAGTYGLIKRGKARKEEAKAEGEFTRKEKRINKRLAKQEEESKTYEGYDFGNPDATVMGSERYQRKMGGVKNLSSNMYQAGGYPTELAFTDDMSSADRLEISQKRREHNQALRAQTVTNADIARKEKYKKNSEWMSGTWENIKKDPITAGQIALAGAEMTDLPIYSQAAGILNTGISGVRGLYNTAQGDSIAAKSHYTDAGLGLTGLGASLIPAAGMAADTTKMARLVSKLNPNKIKTIKTVGQAADKTSQVRHVSHVPAYLEDPNVHATGGTRVPGGKVVPIPGSDAVEFKGQTHAEGGIALDENTEVEDNETMDQVTMKDKGKQDYFFSSYLKRGGRSYADIHKSILKKGGSQKAIDILAKMQEKDASRNPEAVQVAAVGGPRKYQTGGLETAEDEYNTLGLEGYENNTEPDLSLFEKMQQKYQDYRAGAPERQQNRAIKGLNRDVPIASQIAAVGQMIPALYAFKHKEKPVKQVEGAERVIAPDLNRVNFNTDRAKADSDYRALNKSIETSGSGPASVIAKMASYSKKQDANQKITTAETRTNQEIENREAALQQQAATQNIANKMRVDTMNTQLLEAQRIAEENTKKEALDVGFKNIAGISSDVLAYQAAEREARAIGVYGIDERRRLRESLRGKLNEKGEPYSDAEIAQIVNQLIPKE